MSEGPGSSTTEGQAETMGRGFKTYRHGSIYRLRGPPIASTCTYHYTPPTIQ